MKTEGINSEGEIAGLSTGGISLYLKLDGAYRQFGGLHNVTRENAAKRRDQVEVRTAQKQWFSGRVVKVAIKGI